MKKFLALLLAALLVFSLTACFGSKDEDKDKDDEEIEEKEKDEKDEKDDEDSEDEEDKEDKEDKKDKEDEEDDISEYIYAKEQSGMYGEVTLMSDGEIVYSIVQYGEISLEGATDDDVELLIDMLAGEYEDLDFFEFEHETDDDYLYLTMTFKDLDDSDNIKELRKLDLFGLSETKGKKLLLSDVEERLYDEDYVDIEDFEKSEENKEDEKDEPSSEGGVCYWCEEETDELYLDPDWDEYLCYDCYVEWNDDFYGDEDEEPVVDADFSIGEIDGTCYENSYLGFGIDLEDVGEDTWDVYDGDEIAALNGIDEEYGSAEYYDELYDISYFYLYFSMNESNNNINMTLSDLGGQTLDDDDIEQTLEYSFEVAESSFESMGFKNVDHEITTVEIANEEYAALYVTGEAANIEMHQLTFLKVCDSYLCTCAITAVNEEMLDEMVDAFYEV